MFLVEIVVHDELNDFITPKKANETSRVVNCKRRSIKDLIESLGIPHTEVGKIVANGFSVKSSQVIQGESKIEIFPFRMNDSARADLFSGGEFRFLCDVHLGTLARNLRLLGFDAAYNRKWTDGELAMISIEEDRIILTRDRHLLMRKNVEKGVCIRNQQPDRQILELLNRLGLKNRCCPFTRCLACNGILCPAGPGKALSEVEINDVPEKVRHWCQEYTICDSCHKVYWKGSHYRKLQDRIACWLS